MIGGPSLRQSHVALCITHSLRPGPGPALPRRSARPRFSALPLPAFSSCPPRMRGHRASTSASQSQSQSLQHRHPPPVGMQCHHRPEITFVDRPSVCVVTPAQRCQQGGFDWLGSDFNMCLLHTPLIGHTAPPVPHYCNRFPVVPRVFQVSGNACHSGGGEGAESTRPRPADWNLSKKSRTNGRRVLTVTAL